MKKIVLILGIVFLLSDITSILAQSTSNDDKVFIQYLSGTVTVDGVKANIGQELKKGQILKTGPNSKADIVFNKSNILSLKEKSIIDIDIESKDRVVNLKSGQVSGVLKNLDTKNRGMLSIKTPTTVAGVRGTSLFANAFDGEATYICTCNGHVDYADSNGGNQETVEAKEHSALFYHKRPDGFITVEPASGINYHNSASMDEVAAKIGLKIDWSKAEK